MNRTTVKLPEEIDARMRHEAARRGMTVSQWTREAIEAHLQAQTGTGERVRRLGAGGAGRSRRDDIAERIEELLRDELP